MRQLAVVVPDKNVAGSPGIFMGMRGGGGVLLEPSLELVELHGAKQ